MGRNVRKKANAAARRPRVARRFAGQATDGRPGRPDLQGASCALPAAEDTACGGNRVAVERAPHVSVLAREVLELLSPREGGRYLDGTLGYGGHAEGLLRRARDLGLEGVSLLGLDRDTEALALARRRLAPFGEAVHTAHARFSEFEPAMEALGWDALDGALIDIGVSSMQIDVAERGFSFFQDGPLDMRMDRHGGRSAHAVVNGESVARLREIIAAYGEDPMAGRIARAIDDARAAGEIVGTAQLARIVETAYPAAWRARSRNHPATRTFQALRIYVNDELGELERFLERIVARLAPGGRVGVISFHSLEDRIVKHAFRDAATGCRCPRHIPVCVCGRLPQVRLITRKPVVPGNEEIAANPRAGSAKLRVAENARHVEKAMRHIFHRGNT